jgi:hypothetical protein
MRLVIQIEAVADQLFELDFRWSFRPSAVETAPVAAISAVPTIAAFAMRWPALRTVAARAATRRSSTFPGGPRTFPGRAPAFARRTAFLFRFLLLWHVLNLSH